MANPIGQLSNPFPSIRPNLDIVEGESTIREIDFVELRWWFGIPRPGDHTSWASYDAETLKLSRVTDVVATVPARIHGIECIEMQVNEWSPQRGWENGGLVFYARIEGAAESRWVAIVSRSDGRMELFTVLDEGFESQWGASANSARELYDDGRYQIQPDGSYKTTSGTGLGAGAYDVTIGESTFRCLRVLEPDLEEPEGGELNELYVNRRGRAVFHRRYDGRFYRGTDLLQKYPDHPRITIDDHVYVQSDCTGRSHDDITNTALGIYTEE
jgi:hypothetical protein